MARVFYLYTSARLGCDTVFYKVAGVDRAKVLLQLFCKQYALASGGVSFSMTPEDEVAQDERILLEEALDWLGIYDDPDPGIYDPPPTQDMIERAQYARRASSWETYVAPEDTDEANHTLEQPSETQPPGTSEEKSRPPKVFISYSHDSEAHSNRVLELSDKLRAHGVDCHIDLYEESPPEGWPRWCDRQVREADFVLVACTSIYLRRFRGEEEHGKGLGGTWEGHIITQELYNAQGSNTKFLPIIFDGQDTKFIPTPLQGATHYHLSKQYDDLYRRLTNQPKIIRPALGDLRSMPPRQMPALPELKPRKSFFVPQAESFSHEETIHSGGEELYNDLIAENSISHSVAASHTVRELIEEIARHSNQPIPIDSISAKFGEQRASRGHTFFGNPGDYLEQILASHPNVRWWISIKGLNVHADTPDGKVSERSQEICEYKTEEVGGDKSTALNSLYIRIEKVAYSMNGTATRSTSSRSFPSAVVAVPRSEGVPTLVVEMPDSFQVEFASPYPLSIGNTLSVQAKRSHYGSRKTDWQFTLGPEGWRRTQAPLSDDEIRLCLTPEGPRPVF